MSDFNEQSFQRRSLLLLVLVGIFVISVLCVSVSLLVLRNQIEDDYLGPKNVLLIIIDDLRPTLGCYGDKIAVTPNIDQLASKGVLFKSAYVQEALGAPSRISFMTSRRPDSLHLYDSGSYWRDAVKDFVTLPQHFKFHGYDTISVGKVFPYGTASNMTDDYPYSWTRYPYHPSTHANGNHKVCPSNNGDFLICPVNDSKLSGSLPDVETTDYAISYLKNKTKASDQDTPFFLSIGYYRPHIPFQIPKEYLELYPIDSLEMAPNQNITPMLLNIAWNPWTDIREKDDIKGLNISFPYEPLPDDMQLKIRQAYYASVSYIDDQIGKLLQALEETKHAEHTSIVLIGDNGWSLGEHQEWSKYSNFEVSLKVPLIFYIPEVMEDTKTRTPFQHHEVLKHSLKYPRKSSKSTASPKEVYAPKYVTKELVELVDLFPTLTKVVNIPMPPLCRVYSTPFCSEGLNFYPLIEQIITDPLSDFSWKTAVFSQFPRPSIVPQTNSDQPALEDIKFMGYSIRTPRFRYTEWVGFNNTHFRPNWTNVVHAEIYDHKFDPFELDNKLLSDLKHDYLNVVADLSKQIKKGWRHAMPHGFFDSPRKFDKEELL